MTEFLVGITSGLSYGCVYALLALGLVLAFRTSGVFNLAFGALAFVVALLYSASRQANWPEWLALICWVIIFAPAMGIFLDSVLFRFVRARSTPAKIIAPLGLLIAIPPIAAYLISSGTSQSIYPVFFNPARVYFRLVSVPINGGLLSTFLATTIVVVALVLILNKTNLGLKMRAAVESPRFLNLLGINSERISAISWALSSLLTGLAGVLLAPIIRSIDPISITDLLVASIGAAAIGGMTSLLGALVGALFLGVAQQLIVTYVPPGNAIIQGLRPSLPFFILVIVVALVKHFRTIEVSSDPLSAVDPPLPPPEHVTRSRYVDRRVKATFLVFLALVILFELTLIPVNFAFSLSQAFSLAIILLSVTVVSGIGGQISLCQASFAGIGAFTAGQLADRFNVPILGAIIIGAVIACVCGVLVSLTSIKIGGLSLALVTLGFALLADNLLFPASFLGNGTTGISVPQAQLGPINFSYHRPMIVLVTLFLAVAIFLTVRVRDGLTGRYIRASALTGRGASSVGINTASARIMVIGFGAFLAGLGGGLYGSVEGSISAENFVYQFSLVFVVLVLALGSRTVDGAIVGGLFWALIPSIAGAASSTQGFGALENIVFGLFALYFVIHPEGLIEHQKRLVFNKITSYIDRKSAQGPSSRLEGEVLDHIDLLLRSVGIKR